MPFRWFRVNGSAYVAVHRTVQLKDVRLFGRLRLPKTSRHGRGVGGSLSCFSNRQTEACRLVSHAARRLCALGCEYVGKSPAERRSVDAVIRPYRMKTGTPMEGDTRHATAALHRPTAVHLIYIGSVRSQRNKRAGVAKNNQSRPFALADFLASPGAKNVALATGNSGANSSNATIVTPVGSSQLALRKVNNAAT